MILEVENLCCSYGGLRSVDDVTFSLEPGSVTALVGPNGAGKTTLLNALTGLVPIDSGKVVLNGHDITRKPAHKRTALGISRSFQLVRLFHDLSVRANVQLGRAAKGYPDFLSALFHLPGHRRYEKESADQAEAALDLVGMREFADRPAEALSHGQSRRVEIARGMSSDPRILLLDEPTSGLHAEIIGDLVPVLRAASDRGMTLLLVEHNLKFVGEVADRVIVLDRGRLIADGAPSEVVNDPKVVAAYLGGVGAQEADHADT